MSVSIVKIDHDALKIAPGSKIIKAREYMHLLSVLELEKEVKQRRQELDNQANSLKIKSIESGLNQGAQEAKSRLAKQLLNSASSMVDQLKKIEVDLADVVVSAVRKIISDFDDRTLVLEAIKKGLQPIYKSQRVAIRVNPQMVPQIAAGIDELEHEIEFLEVVPDEQLGSTDCVLESDMGIVNASIDTQLSVIEQAVRNQMQN